MELKALSKFWFFLLRQHYLLGGDEFFHWEPHSICDSVCCCSMPATIYSLDDYKTVIFYHFFIISQNASTKTAFPSFIRLPSSTVHIGKSG